VEAVVTLQIALPELLADQTAKQELLTKTWNSLWVYVDYLVNVLGVVMSDKNGVMITQATMIHAVLGADHFPLTACYGIHEMVGKVWDRAQHPEGCKWVQLVLPNVSNAWQEFFALELQASLQGPGLVAAVKHPQANFVMQLVVRLQAMRSAMFPFLYSGMLGQALAIAKHEKGCRFVQRLLEWCAPEQVEHLVKELLADVAGVVALIKHPYGNYVVQKILEYGTESWATRITQVLENNLSETETKHGYALAVIATALDEKKSKATEYAKEALAAKFLIYGCLPETVAMICNRFGIEAMKNALKVAKTDEPEAAARVLREWRQEFWKPSDRTLNPQDCKNQARFGKAFVKFLDEPF